MKRKVERVDVSNQQDHRDWVEIFRGGDDLMVVGLEGKPNPYVTLVLGEAENGQGK